MKLEELAKKIIRDNEYLALATSEGTKPWASPVHYGVDGNYIFYFVSIPSSKHCSNIDGNPKVSFAIYNSTVPEGQGNGIQVDGKAELLENSEYEHALQYYKSVFVSTDIEGLMKSPYRIYKITPEHIFINDPHAKVDGRVEIKL
ncbi:MAG TPA: pyridoxamine 5'-phosphate oxidase family protein [Patescibacteria group bacterium]|nr:pyridoxamine 5'-phosphate oxidase family protein [Patescibacteria group bacterium]